MSLSSSSRTLLILLSLALVLLGLVLLTGTEEAEPSDQAFRPFADEEIDEVEINLDAGGGYRLDKQGMPGISVSRLRAARTKRRSGPL